MRTQMMIALIALAGIAPSGLSYAATTSEKPATMKEMTSKLKGACQSDIDTLCTGVTPGEGRIAACLNSKQDQLSSGCKTQWISTKADISKRMDKAEVAFRKDCGADVNKFCSNVPSGKGRLLSCLDQHQADLSNSCQSFQSKLDERLAKFLG